MSALSLNGDFKTSKFGCIVNLVLEAGVITSKQLEIDIDGVSLEGTQYRSIMVMDLEGFQETHLEMEGELRDAARKMEILLRLYFVACPDNSKSVVMEVYNKATMDVLFDTLSPCDVTEGTFEAKKS